jgi:hypothetical protein
VAALALGHTVAAMVMATDCVTARSRGLRKALVAHDVFAHPMQQLNRAYRVPGGRPDSQVDRVSVIGGEDDFFVASFGQERTIITVVVSDPDLLY